LPHFLFCWNRFHFHGANSLVSFSFRFWVEKSTQVALKSVWAGTLNDASSPGVLTVSGESSQEWEWGIGYGAWGMGNALFVSDKLLPQSET